MIEGGRWRVDVLGIRTNTMLRVRQLIDRVLDCRRSPVDSVKLRWLMDQTMGR